MQVDQVFERFYYDPAREIKFATLDICYVDVI